MAKLTDHTISLADLTFHYREAGDSGPPPLILLHAPGTDAQDWNGTALALADRYASCLHSIMYSLLRDASAPSFRGASVTAIPETCRLKESDPRGSRWL